MTDQLPVVRVLHVRREHHIVALQFTFPGGMTEFRNDIMRQFEQLCEEAPELVGVITWRPGANDRHVLIDLDKPQNDVVVLAGLLGRLAHNRFKLELMGTTDVDQQPARDSSPLSDLQVVVILIDDRAAGFCAWLSDPTTARRDMLSQIMIEFRQSCALSEKFHGVRIAAPPATGAALVSLQAPHPIVADLESLLRILVVDRFRLVMNELSEEPHALRELWKFLSLWPETETS